MNLVVLCSLFDPAFDRIDIGLRESGPITVRHVDRRVSAALDEHHENAAQVVAGQHYGTVPRTIHQFFIARHTQTAGFVTGAAGYVAIEAMLLQDRLNISSVTRYGLAALAIAKKHD